MYLFIHSLFHATDIFELYLLGKQVAEIHDFHQFSLIC